MSTPLHRHGPDPTPSIRLGRTEPTAIHSTGFVTSIYRDEAPPQSIAARPVRRSRSTHPAPIPASATASEPPAVKIDGAGPNQLRSTQPDSLRRYTATRLRHNRSPQDASGEVDQHTGTDSWDHDLATRASRCHNRGSTEVTQLRLDSKGARTPRRPRPDRDQPTGERLAGECGGGGGAGSGDLPVVCRGRGSGTGTGAGRHGECQPATT